ncbi:uncharacterized protein F4807DRAFT_423881 [Annulohypoxylon truncatum]|uniref:uncharacterized protein n=1 Tax=Annulohypoxylon truncatum TaxID=327061 RepID=UPI002007C04D|nr:uncharacterized protein F4807DRAFT_423881 [Annulohypoxylon truncatum]KAI1210121.1 hypothetical protein F4807DRAFT_423881 [Annulohypoxylon truncatum]
MFENTNRPLLIRRNGRPQACDPCRKRKLACDHAQPVCNRCRKRKQDAECVYIISDSKTSGSKSPLPSPAPSTPRSVSRRTPRPIQNTPEVTSSIQASTLTRPGYLGPTSYCDIYEDTENSLSLLRRSECTSSHCENTANNSLDGASQDVMSPRVREMCLTALRNIPDAKNGNTLRFKLGNDGWVRPVALRGVKAFYDTFGHIFTPGNRTTAQLEELAQIICANTLKPFSDNESDPEKWLDQFMGRNTRWELIGMLSNFWEFVPASDATALWKGKRSAEYDKSFRISRDNIRLCFELCKEFTTGNTLVLYLSQKCVVVESMIVGDANLLVWRSHAEGISLCTFLGYHAMRTNERHSTTVTSEIKKVLFHHKFIMAMVIVSFTGRPPLIASRYSSTPLPLDLSEQELFSDHATFMRAVGRLDEKGWNTDGLIHHATRIRARAIIARLREELFEIALANDQVAPIETLLALRARELQAVADFPTCIHFNPLDLEDPEISIDTLASRSFIHLEHLQNMFFIERLLLRNGHEDKGDLLRVSYDLVILTLPYYLELDKMAAFRNDCEWLVMAYAVPAGGILCLELLKPTLHIRPHIDPRITRANIIQKLTLLVAFLEWVSPSGSGPNGDLCSDAKSVIQRVLDQTLNAASSVYEPPVFEWDFSTQVDFNFDLLDTFDWNRPDFPSSQQSNQ